jgi:uncharacterized protein
MSRTTNRLAHELSPYLLQHAHNPVDWRPWGPEALRAAREQDKPIFLSIGYATCHWCHVMERESFEHEATAAAMNQAFVCIKVDREERPDLDTVYMTACQLMNNQGGWPLNVLLTPEAKPFFAATYLPRESGFGRMGLGELAERVSQLWKERRQEILDSAESLTQSLRQVCRLEPERRGDAKDIDRSLLLAGYKELRSRFDAQYGGFGNAPKFPTPHNLLFLLHLAGDPEAPEAMAMVEKTLTAMRLGGIFDHVGFGFHRYSTDARWLLPHFEKMLHDQALLALACVEAHQATGDSVFRNTAEEVFTYVLRDLVSPEGAFYSAEDADSEGEEGRFYVFTLEEARKALNQDADLAAALFNCTPEGNFRDEASGKHTGANILHLNAPLEQTATLLGQAPQALAQRMEQARQRLFAARERRIRPLLDDKVLTDWNGLMLAALARAARCFPESRYLRDATRAAEFVLRRLRGEAPPGETLRSRPLLHRYRENSAGLPAHLDDYAFFCWGLVELHLAGGGEAYLDTALELCELMLELFWDTEAGGLFLTSPRTGEELICRPKELHDGALPSGNAVAVLVLQRLAHLTGRDDLRAKAMELRAWAAPMVARFPGAHTFLLAAVAEELHPR